MKDKQKVFLRTELASQLLKYELIIGWYLLKPAAGAEKLEFLFYSNTFELFDFCVSFSEMRKHFIM